MEPEYETEPLSLEDKLALVRSRLWTPELDKLLRRWKRQIDARRKGHIKLSQQYDKRHYLLGVPATVLTTITTTGTLTTFQDCSSNSTGSFWCTSAEWIRLAIGIIGIIAVVLTGILTFMNFQKTSQDHKKAADEYESLAGTIDSILSIPRILRGNPVDRLKLIRDQYDGILKEAPTLAEKYKTELGFEVVGSRNPNNKVINISNGKLDPNDVNIDDRSIEMVKKDKTVLKKIMEDLRSKNQENSPEKNSEVPSPKKSLKVVIRGDEFSNEEESNVVDEIVKRNNFDSDDESQEVCIGFDIDRMAEMNQNTTALAMANLQAQRDRQIQDSLNQALRFEIDRLGGATPRKKSPRNNNFRINRSRNNTYEYPVEYSTGSPSKNGNVGCEEYPRRNYPNLQDDLSFYYTRQNRDRKSTGRSSVGSPTGSPTGSPVGSPQRKSQQTQILHNLDSLHDSQPLVNEEDKVQVDPLKSPITDETPEDIKIGDDKLVEEEPKDIENKT